MRIPPAEIEDFRNNEGSRHKGKRFGYMLMSDIRFALASEHRILTLANAKPCERHLPKRSRGGLIALHIEGLGPVFMILGQL